MRNLGWKLADFDPEFDLNEFQLYYLRRNERKKQ